MMRKTALKTDISPEFNVNTYCQFLRVYDTVATYVIVNKCQGLPAYSDRIIRLDFHLNNPIQIPDLVVDNEGISGTLSFNSQRRHVIVPWQAVDEFLDGKLADQRTSRGQVLNRLGNVVKVRFR